MIERKQIRVGNLIADKNGNEVSVLDIYMTGEGYSLRVMGVKVGIPDPQPIESFKPIPLTEEWLVKLGFEKVISNAVDFIGRPMKIVDFNLGSWTVNDEKGKYTFCVESALGLTDIQYVHQLQNLYFALTGTELTIK